jgi:Interleukin-like EMT inducer
MSNVTCALVSMQSSKIHDPYVYSHQCWFVCMFCRLSQETRSLIHSYGSDAIHKVQFRENFAMVGQKGLSRGTAVEQVC